MSRTINSQYHEALRQFLIAKRKEAGLTQAEVAQALGRHQPFISDIEKGQRRVDVAQLMELAEVIGFDPHDAIDYLNKSKKRRRA